MTATDGGQGPDDRSDDERGDDLAADGPGSDGPGSDGRCSDGQGDDPVAVELQRRAAGRADLDAMAAAVLVRRAERQAEAAAAVRDVGPLPARFAAWATRHQLRRSDLGRCGAGWVLGMRLRTTSGRGEHYVPTVDTDWRVAVTVDGELVMRRDERYVSSRVPGTLDTWQLVADLPRSVQRNALVQVETVWLPQFIADAVEDSGFPWP